MADEPNQELEYDFATGHFRPVPKEQQVGAPASEVRPPAAGAPAPAPAAKPAPPAQPLHDILTNAAKSLGDGYTIRFTSEDRPGARVSGTGGVSQHSIPGHAVDVQIIGPDGKALPNRGADTSGKYGELWAAAREYAQKNHPELAQYLRWGGNFTVSGRPGDAADLMHFDLRGWGSGAPPSAQTQLARAGGAPAQAGGSAEAIMAGGAAAPPQAGLPSTRLSRAMGTEAPSVPVQVQAAAAEAPTPAAAETTRFTLPATAPAPNLQGAYRDALARILASGHRQPVGNIFG